MNINNITHLFSNQTYINNDMVITTSQKLGSLPSPIHDNYYLASSQCSMKKADIQ